MSFMLPLLHCLRPPSAIRVGWSTSGHTKRSSQVNTTAMRYQAFLGPPRTGLNATTSSHVFCSKLMSFRFRVKMRSIALRTASRESPTSWRRAQ